MMALMLHYAMDYEEAAYQYARALIRRLSADVVPYEATQLARDIVTETTNDIRDLGGEDIRIPRRIRDRHPSTGVVRLHKDRNGVACGV